MRVGKDERAGERLYSCERAARVTEGMLLPIFGATEVTVFSW